MFDELRTLDDIRRSRKIDDKSGRYQLRWAEPGPLMEHAVRLAGEDGLTLQRLRDVFSVLGKERFERGLQFMRGAGEITERRERRPNRARRLQEQVVFYRGSDADR